ncbi:MAG: MFS transporter [Gammaproteobacteria bacterium]|jgi:UMF1 family MFS transporter
MRHTRERWGWVFYDWANSAFATTVMAGFFPVYFKAYWNTGLDATVSTFRLGLANSVASLLIVMLAPVLGAMADCMSRRKAMLFIFACLGWLMTGGLYLVAEGDWILAALFYVLAVIGFSGSNVFYDSLLPFVSSNEELDRTSAFGFALGYLGGGVMFACNILMVMHPDWFGLADSDAAVRVSFLMVAVWWLVFSLPLLLLVKEPDGSGGGPALRVISEGFVRVWHTLHEVRRLRNLWLFLIAYWLYIDGVDTIVRMAVDYGMSLGFDHKSLLMALLITQFTGFPAAVAFGYIGSRFGPRAGILIGLFVYMVVTVRASVMSSPAEFYLLAFAIGLAQGGIQALSRSLYARMIPGNRTAEFFGFYNMLGKFAAVIGPVMMGWVGALSASPRTGILSLLVLFIAGALVLLKVEVDNNQSVA